MELVAVDSLKGGLILTHFGEELNEEDEKIVDFVSTFDKPSAILYHVKGLKEEGNLLFKKGIFREALDKYSWAIKCLSFAIVEDDGEKSEFIDLARSLFLNEVACSLKLFDYVRAGQLCSVVLESDSRNVKALYRRVVAALELGEFLMARSDLTKAVEFDPNNKEVTEKLKDVTDQLIHKAIWMSGDDGVGQCKQYVNGPFSSKSHVSKASSTQIKEGEDEVEVFKPKGGVGTLPRRGARFNSSCSLQVQQMEVDSPVSSSSPSHVVCQESSSVGSSPDLASVDSSPPVDKNYLEEPFYRFANRRRGSFLQISPSSYEALKQGKSISFYNSSQGAVLKIRALPKHSSTQFTPKEKCEASSQQDCPMDLECDSTSSLTVASSVDDDTSFPGSTASVPGDKICTIENVFRFTSTDK